MPGSRTRRGAAKRPASQSKPGSDPPDGVSENDQRLKGGDAANDGPSGLEAAEEAQKPAPSKPAVVTKAKGSKRRGTAAVADPASTAAKKNQKAKASSAKSGPTPGAAKKTTHPSDPPVAEECCDKEQSKAEAGLENGAGSSAAVGDKGGEEEGKEEVTSPMFVEEQKAPAGRGGRKGKAQPTLAEVEKPPRRGSSRAKAAVKYVGEDNDVRTPGDGGVWVCLS